MGFHEWYICSIVIVFAELMHGWMVGWMVDWLIGWLVDWGGSGAVRMRC